MITITPAFIAAYDECIAPKLKEMFQKQPPRDVFEEMFGFKFDKSIITEPCFGTAFEGNPAPHP